MIEITTKSSINVNARFVGFLPRQEELARLAKSTGYLRPLRGVPEEAEEIRTLHVPAMNVPCRGNMCMISRKREVAL
jgi:hypothetical protein